MRRSGQAITLPQDGLDRSVVRARNEGQPRPGFEPDHFPVVAGIRDGLVIAVIEDRLVALDAGSGVQRWEVPVRGGGEHWPAVEGESVYVASVDDVIAVDAAAWTTRWRVPVDPAVSPPVRVGGRLYVATRSRLLALDAASGRPLWTSAKERIVNGPLATPASVVVATADGILLGFAP
jgi:outer membrane protein assembly factor BamB